ncbi:MAG: hypothetical protein AAFU67_09535, partial [Bacteroidota bacterium]
FVAELKDYHPVSIRYRPSTVYLQHTVFKSKKQKNYLKWAAGFTTILLLITVLGLLNYLPSKENVASGSIKSSEARDALLNGAAPTQELILLAMEEFTFSGTGTVSNQEAGKILQFLGAKNLEFIPTNNEDIYMGFLPSKHKLAIWIGAMGRKNMYGFRHNNKPPNEEEPHFVLPIE